jgi:hypothetical protein
MKKLVVVMVGLVLLAGCSSESGNQQAEKPQPKPPEYVTGRTAFQKLYISARGWARDAQPYRLQSQVTSDWNGKDGKSVVWRANFASPAQRGTKPYVWSGSNATDAPPRGIEPGTEDNYSPTNSSTQVFDIAFLKVDSDKAFEVAQKHGGDKILEKAPDTPVLYMLDWSTPTSELIWHVAYGQSMDSAKLKVDVNGSNGEFIRVEK